MTKQEFDTFWNSRYPETKPIDYLFKHQYPNRWLRIHSLPRSQRYAQTESEWDIILLRQNKIITDLIGDNAEVLLVTGQYSIENVEMIDFTKVFHTFGSYSFLNLEEISLNELDYFQKKDNLETYTPAFAKTTWMHNTRNGILRAIAIGDHRAFFISTEKNIIIAPYDGGMDIILPDTETRDLYKLKYKNWLTSREDGY